MKIKYFALTYRIDHPDGDTEADSILYPDADKPRADLAFLLRSARRDGNPIEVSRGRDDLPPAYTIDYGDRVATWMLSN